MALPEFVQALLRPEAYPDKVEAVELVQTQISFAFLTGKYVYKVKKPVDFGFLDFTTLEKRRFYCQQEVSLNRRLCDDTYLDVVPVSREGEGFRVEGSGEVVEYAVKMRQLPRQRMMDNLLQSGQVTPEMLRGVAEKLVEFHSRAGLSEEHAVLGGLDSVTRNVEENFVQTDGYIGRTISQEQYDHIKDYTCAFIEENRPLFAGRVKEGRIKDCHGDLHAAHICFSDSICIFDCIEFNDRFRYTDVANEIAFLAMDLDCHSRLDLARGFIDAYVDISGDWELLKLLDFYKCYRAYVRGKVEGFKLDDPHISEDEKTRGQALAKRYFELAESYI
ncbi:hypothetical protein ACFLVI_02080 [Chloroflexota bacterium]